MHYFATVEINFHEYLVELFDAGGEDAPDIYLIESANVKNT